MPLQPATPAPAALQDLLTQLGLSSNGHPVFLLFFRSDCPWCASEVTHLAEVFARTSHKFSTHVVGIAGGEDDEATARQFAKEKNWPYPVAVDTNGALRSAFGITRVPAIVAINGHGLVERTYEGVTEQLSGILEQTVLSAARGTTPPEYDMIGNGCAP